MFGRFQRVGKHDKFTRSAWEFDVVLTPRQKKIPDHKVIQNPIS